MKQGILIAALFISSLTGSSLSGQELPGIPMFGDDFNVSGLFVENWEFSKGAKCEDGRVVIPAGQSVALKRIPEGDFAFAADLTVEKPAGKEFGHCGAIIDGIHFMITPRTPPHANTAYRVPGETRSRGNSVGTIPGLEFGKPCRIMVSRHKLGEGYKYSYKVNDYPVDSFPVVMPVNGKISFYGYKTDLAIDNFQLYALKGDGSRNLAVNSSFEYLQEGMPNYMRPLPGGRYAFNGKWEAFIKHFAIDTREKVSGRQSARMTCGTNAPSGNGVATYNVNVMAKTPVTFSIYLRASEDDFPATLNIWELHHKTHSKPVTLSKAWKRHVFTVANPERATVRASVGFSKPGTVWADDLQVEIGSNATPYMPSSLDKDKYTAEPKGETPAIEADTILKAAGEAPVIDGTLEAVWFTKGAKIDTFFLNGRERPPNRTEAYVTCDEDNLYLAVRAHVPDIAKVKGTKLAHDNLRVHSEDCIEVFLDTTLGRERYYHLTVNAAGSKTDMGPGRILAWNGAWEAATTLNAKENSIDYEMKFPLRLFAGIDMAGKWGLNIGRNDTERNAVYSLIHTADCNFHLPALFPAIVFPAGLVDKYKVGFKELHLVSGKEAKMGVVGTIGNLSGKALASDIRITDGATGLVIGTQPARIDNGSTEVLVPVSSAPDAKGLDGIVEIVIDGSVRASQSRRINRVRELDVYTRYNYYMNEEAAVLVGALRLPDADKLTGRISVAGKTFDVAMEPEFAFDIPLKGIANGEHPVTLDVCRGAEKLASATTTLVKREFRAGATQIDHQRRCLVVDGKPYLAITPFFGVERGIKPEQQEMVLKNMVRLHKEMGYKCFLAGAVDDMLVPQQAQEFFILCAKEGIKIIYWPFQSWNRRDKVTPEQRLQTMKGNNIIAWLVVDEPELYAKSEEVEAFMDAHQKASPYTPIFMNNTLIGIPGRYAGLKTDILMLDDYLTNRERRKVVEMINATSMMEEAGREDRKPVFYFLAGENLHNHYRECTYAEQVAETYGVIIAGARGVSYFCSLPLYPEDYRACVDVNRELLELEEAIFSLEKTSSAAMSDPAVKSMTRKLGDRIIVVALNSDNDRALDVDITLPPEFQYARRVEVKFEDRRIKVRNGRLSDTFKALERHVYVAEIVK